MAVSLPPHLANFLVEQRYDLYTPQDQVCWRFILNSALPFFKEHAHEKYLAGLKATGISTEYIPKIDEMNARLQEFGWQTVPICGFLPPVIFMEFYSLKILPIACDMRKAEHLSYTPSPDIVHEAAGHAPILADADYAAYLEKYGEIAKHAIYSKHDEQLYKAIRLLSDLKEDPRSENQSIVEAEAKVHALSQQVVFPSEAANLARLNWWTVEYGLVGPKENPKIYGAGLLSSLSESYHCLDAQVEKRAYSLDCMNVSYDITRPQPQLFVAEDFNQLTDSLEQYSQSMGYKLGGIKALKIAKEAATVTTTKLNSELKISGVLADIKEQNREAYYLRYQGPVQLSVGQNELKGQGASVHKHGYSTPLGRLQSGELLREKTWTELQGQKHFVFKSGVHVQGLVFEYISQKGQPILIRIQNCKVWFEDEILFEPSWGVFDMALAESVLSVQGGPSDFAAYYKGQPEMLATTTRQKSNLTTQNEPWMPLYDQVLIRSHARTKPVLENNQVDSILNIPPDSPHWLILMETLRQSGNHVHAETKRLVDQLKKIQQASPEQAETIQRGLDSLNLNS